MAQQTDSIDALLQAQANQAQPAPTSSVAAAPDPIAAALSARAVGKDPSAAFSGIMPSQGKAAADRAVTLADNATTMPVLGALGVGGEMAKNYLDSHLAPGSLLRRGADAVLGNAVDANAAFTHAVQNVPLSVAQLAMHGAAAAGDALSAPQQNIAGLVSGAAPQRAGVAGALDRARNALDTAIANREHTYQSGIPNSVGGITGAIAGNVLPFAAGGEVSAGARLADLADAATGAVKAVPKVGGIAQKVLSGALQGGAYSLAQPITATQPGQSYGGALADRVGTGLLLGGAVPVVGHALGQAYNVVRPFVNPAGVVRDYLGNLVGDQAGAVAQRLRSAPTYVPGSLPTSAQAGGNTALVQAEKALANQSPSFKTALTERDVANNAARLDALAQLAGTPADMQAAVQARRAAVDPFVGQYLNPQTRMDPSAVMNTLQGLRFGPLGVNAQRAAKLDNLITSLQGATTPDGTIGLDMADAVRQEAGKLSRGSSGQNRLAYAPANDSIVQAINRVAPGYPDYLRTYAAASQPITDLGAASAMVDSLGSGARNSAGSPQVTLPAFNAQLRKLDKLPYSVSPKMQGVLQGIQSDLQRASISNSVRAPGSDTAYNLNTPGWLASKVYGEKMGQSGPVADMVRKLPLGIGPFLTGIKDVGSNRVLNAAQNAMLNPTVMAQELEKLRAVNPRLLRLLAPSIQRTAAISAPALPQQRP